jgi:hypothetical protein
MLDEEECTSPRSSTTPPASSWPSSAGSTRSSPTAASGSGTSSGRGTATRRPTRSTSWAGRWASRSASRCAPSRSRSTSPAQEMLITAPELNHLRPGHRQGRAPAPLTHRLGREMLPKPAGNGINHQPQFQAHFINNARIVSRLPNRDGKGVKGMHPLVIEMDEAGLPRERLDRAHRDHEALRRGRPVALCTASRGHPGPLLPYTMGENPDLPFYVHRYMAMHRPSWSPGGAQGEDRHLRRHRGQRRLPPQHLRRARRRHQPAVRAAPADGVRPDQRESAWATEYNDDVYTQIKINDELLRVLRGADRDVHATCPATHLDEQYSSFWAGHGRRLHPRPVRDPGLRCFAPFCAFRCAARQVRGRLAVENPAA